ncbi:MAG: PEP-CTERM sorting domain-containing protein [Phycisphaerae bacterium]|nr:PEP-CTERM sorting domain-containing protein [Phycisphaerae bacterium]
MLRKLALCGVAMVAVGVLVTAQAGADPWEGYGDHFHAFNGDEATLFGIPDISGSTITFTDVEFTVTSDEAGQVVQEDTVTFDVDIAEGYYISGVTVYALGNYDVVMSTSYVDQGGEIAIHERTGGGRTWNNDEWTHNPDAFPRYGTNSGDFTGICEITELGSQIPLPERFLDMSLNNWVEAFAEIGGGGSATINQSYDVIIFDISLIPEPSTLALLGIGALVLIRRR